MTHDKMNILIIDDDLQNQDNLIQLIMQINPKHYVESVHSSVDAQNKLRKEKYDLIIAEIYLKGGLQGHELIQEIRYECFKVGMAKILENPQIRMHFNDFLIRPISKDDIADILAKAKYNKEFNEQFI
ncbi:MAG: response regulator [Promethearchaeota archaeon]